MLSKTKNVFWDGVPLDWWSFPFQRLAVSTVLTSGVPYSRNVWFGMPQIPPAVLKATFYLYATVEDAKKGTKFGGTGFIVAVPSAMEGRNYGYAVSNWHVAVRDGFSVVRINKIDGGVDIFEFDPADWIFIPNGTDVAVTPIGFDRSVHDVAAINLSFLMTRENAAKLSIAQGEDVFMVGRFVDHDGGESNVPAVRFGNISITPIKIKQPTGALRESYVLDMHSRTGFSGSAVYVYRTFGSDLANISKATFGLGHQFVAMLGVHWGQFPEPWQIKQEAGRPKNETIDQETFLSGSSSYIEGMSGMTLAVPAWDIIDLLEVPELKKQRQADDQQLLKNQGFGPKAESASPPANSENPTHQEDFSRLLGAAARKPAQED